MTPAGVELGATPLVVAEALLSCPTAPLVEDQPAAWVQAFAEDHPGLDVERDGAGNLVVRNRGGEAQGGRPLVLVAHLDHPGFAVEGVDGDVVMLSFRGGLSAAHAVPGSEVEFFARDAIAPVGRGSLLEASARDGRLTGARARVLDGEAPGDGFAMWAFPGFELIEGHVTGRVCDDLLGAAMALSALGEVARRSPPDVEVWALFTRAEEIGFLGTLEAIRLATVPRGARVLSIECSSALAGAPQGDGVIVRVGDRRTVFDPGLTQALVDAATRLTGADEAFRWQRKLMDGGTCEASAFGACGYQASGLALPLGNYHNALDAGTGIAPEHVAVDDYLAGVALLVELASAPWVDAPLGAASEWLVEPMARARALLA